MLETSLLLALCVNFLMINPVYQLILIWLKIEKKPFTCPLCMAWWIGILLPIILWDYQYLIVAFTAPLVAIIIERTLNVLPIKLK